MLASCSLHVSGSTPTDALAWLCVCRNSLAVAESGGGGGVAVEVVETWKMVRTASKNVN